MSLPWGVAAHAATTTMTLQPAPTAVDDSYLREDNVTENNATKPDLRVRASSDQHDRNTVIKITPSGLSGKTVLRAWLELYQSAGSSATTLDARIYPLTESWTESIVTWATRDRLVANTPWSTPGGTRSDSWSDRAIVSSSNTGTTTRWQVGPIVQAWNTGSIPNDGFLIEPVRGGVGREVSFNSSDNGTASLRPKLIIQYTDEPPAIRSGVAEIQPRNVREGSHDVPLTVWVDVDAQGATPSGTATGFDALILTHEGALAVTKIDRFVVGGAAISTSALSWTDDGQAVTIRFPRVQINGLVQLDFRADILKPATTSGYDLPISLDDTTTPGAWSQQLWPGNGDRVAGNGDDWILNVINTPPVSIDLTPNAAQIVNRTCLSLALNGRDALGNVFPLQPDSVVILPGTAGTIRGSLTFCAAAPGSAKLIACYGTLRDTSVIDVQPERLTQLQSVTLRDRALAQTSVLSPRDTMFLDVLLSDGDGAQDVKQIDFELQHPLAAGSPSSPAYGAGFRWTRDATPAWTLEHPTGSSWAVLPALCAIDAGTNTTGPVLARLALVVGRIARASTSEWKATASAWSATPADTVSASLAGLQVPVRLSIGTQETLGAFSAGLPGTSGLPLETPPSARIHFNLEANAAFQLEALASDLVGAASPSDTLHVGSPANRLHAGLGSDRTASLPVGTLWSAVGSSLAPETEDPLSSDLYLWIDHPAAIPAQDYVGTLAFRLGGEAQPDTSVSGRLTLRASVVNAGLAAHLGLAEVTPHSVIAGSRGQAFTIYLLPVLQASDTGVDRVRVSVPEGYGTVAISQVRVGGSPVAYQDHSVPGLADVTLNAKVVASQLIELQLTADAPLDLDPEGSSFVVVFDDQSTPVSPQTATEGDANGQADGNNTVVRVVPGPLARIVISPAQTEMFRDSSLAFAAEGQDSLGHPVAATPAWSVEGGVGTVSASGFFTATATGTGRIIARAGAFADSAEVTVFPPRAIAVRSVVGPATVHQGESGVMLHVNLENQSQVPVFLDSLELHFGRARPDDADADFVVSQAPQSVPLAPGSRVALSFTVDVALAALVAPLAVQATASGVEDGSGIRLRDTSPDTSLALGVLPADIEVAALQGTAAVRPGSRDGLLLTLRVTNRYPEARFLESFALTNRTSGSGDRDQLDAELGDVSLYRDDGDGLLDVSRDTLLLKTVALDGAVNFAPLHAAFQGASSGYLFVAVSPPLVARDGDLLDVELASPEDVQFAPQVLYRNGWPVSAPGGRVIDGMVAAQIQVRAVGPAAVHPSAADQLAFDVLLPGNGYTPDGLTALGLINLGSATSSDIAQLRAWSDDGDGIFNATNDAPMGAFAYVGGGRWQLSGLSLGIPASGRRVFVTASMAATATHNATIKLALPAGDDPGARMASGDSGPLDVDAANPSLLTVSDLDRVAVVALALPGGTVIRGAKQVTLGSYSLTNNYATDRTLTSLTVANATSGPGTVAERDAEIRLISLRLDGDGDGVLGDPSVDPVLGTTFYQGGTAAFAGLHLVLAPFQGRQLFVVADVSSEGARDGDRIGCSVSGPTSFDFVEATALSGI
ncbi:MAG TPA: DNRLRE domain-containing protein [Candidatus Eisenbacteria bacterium]|nr:DNRLRE domain-containing protein [Candidatus Eisenbacteria bacterium]